MEKKNLDKKDFYSLWSNLTNAIMDRQETLHRLALQKQLMYEWLPPGFIDDEWRKLQKQRII